ncbi:MAG: NAD(P)-binding protein [Bacteroidetes bacterium]|nr:NAD(P)-binding protein [Bacteroidota bacterium]
MGAGHNALVASAYLAQAGYRVGVFERRPIVGGAVSTQEIVPGYQFDLGGSAHILIRLTPIVEELQLERFGLTYLDLDPLFFAPFPDDEAVFIYRDVDRTVDHLESLFPGQGRAYRRFIDDWRDFSLTVRDTFLASPSPFQLGKSMAFGGSPPMDWKAAMRHITRPYGEVVSEYFSEHKLQTMLAWMAAQSGPPPTEPMTGPFVLWHPLYHEGGIARPRGGSGMLTQALKQHIEAHGGDVFVDAPVTEILMENGEAVGVRVDDEPITARATLAGTHVKESLGRLLPERYRPDFIDNLRLGNGFGAILRLALDRPVRYTAHPGTDARVGLQLICRDMQQLHSAYGSFMQKRPAEDPPIVAMTFSAVDDTLAPPGGEVLWLWAQYFPYELADGQRWEDIKGDVADTILDTFEQYAPGTRDAIVGQLFQHPEWLERELGLFRGNVMHLEMSIDQMFMLRPHLSLSDYRAHVDRLYLTGASTHPGGGIMGASGRNAARVLLKDLD